MDFTDETPPALPPALPDNPREALPGLWDFARRVWNEICALWADPVTLLRQEYLSRRSYRACADWVRNLEDLVRRIVIVAALSVRLAPLRPAPPGPCPRPWGEPRFQRTLWHDPTTWKVAFSMFPARRVSEDAAEFVVARTRKRRREFSLPTAGLARRIEALRRVISWKESYAARFARFLERVRARNRTTNGEPREFHLPSCDFTWERRTSGKYGVRDGMLTVHPLAVRALEIWNEPG